VNTFQLFDDGNHHDSNPNDGIYGGSCISPEEEKDYYAHVYVYSDLDYTHFLNDIEYFTTVGPVILENYSSADTLPNPGDQLQIYLTLKNEGLVADAVDIKASLTCQDTLLTIPPWIRSFDDIAAEEAIEATLYWRIDISELCPAKEIPVVVNVTSNDYIYWTDTILINVTYPVSVEENKNLPAEFALHQNYPNPFNASTIISYQIPESSKVELNIYTLNGKKVTTLISKLQPAGTFKYEWDASTYESGVYYYKLTAGDFEQMKKLILLK